jgi:Ca-activated chloride channel family protein
MYLMDEIKRNGRKDELVTEIVTLAKQYGIVTPYTSYLVADDEMQFGRRDLAARKAALSQVFAAEEKGGWAPAPADSPAGEWRAGRGREADSLEAMIGSVGGASGKSPNEVMEKLRMIGNKSFYQAAGVWTDSTYDPETHKDVISIKAGSDEYMKLVEEKPGIAKYLSLGSVLVIYQGKVYRVEG